MPTTGEDDYHLPTRRNEEQKLTPGKRENGEKKTAKELKKRRKMQEIRFSRRVEIRVSKSAMRKTDAPVEVTTIVHEQPKPSQQSPKKRKGL